MWNKIVNVNITCIKFASIAPNMCMYLQYATSVWGSPQFLYNYDTQ